MLSTHFTLPEFEHDAPVPVVSLPVLTDLCQLILEPVRAQFGALLITSGYRPPAANAAAHGQPDSKHIYTVQWCAADFAVLGNPLGSAGVTSAPRAAFDWMRNNPTLPFHQLILEHGADGTSIVHVSIDRDFHNIRSVLEGATHNAAPYTPVDHVAYTPIESAIDEADA